MEYSDFCRLVQNGAIVILIISGVTGPIFIKLAQDVAKILLLEIFELEWPYSNPFWNTAVPNEFMHSNFALKVIAMATSLKESEKEVQISHLQTNLHHLVKNH